MRGWLRNLKRWMSAQKLVRNSILLVSAEMVAKSLGIVFFALVARFLGAKELGLYAFAMALANFIVIPARFGFENLVLRQVGRDPASTRRYFLDIGAAKVLISLAVLALLVSILGLLRPQDLAVLALAAAFALVYSFMEFTNSFFRANQRTELELWVRSFFSVANLVLGLAVLYGGWQLKGVLGAQLLSAVAAAVLAFAILNRVAPPVAHRWDWRPLGRHLTAAAPFAAILVALFLSNQIGIIILTAVSPKEEVGYFAAAIRLYDSLTLIPAAIMGAFLPVMSQLFTQSLGAFARTLRFTMKYLFVLTAPLVVITTLLAQPIVVLLYREAFAPSALALQVLGGALIFTFWNFAADCVLIAANRERLLLRLTWSAALIHVAANLILVPGLSYRGASLAVLGTQGLYFLILFSVVLRRYFNCRQLLKLITVPVLAALLMGGAIFLTRGQNLLLSILAGITVYVGALLALKGVSRKEINQLQNMAVSDSQVK